MRSCCLLLFVLFICLRSGGQDFSYTQYNVKDGLAGSVVYCAAEDKDGFLWFGTESGLSRFDGTHFKNFTTAGGLPDNEIIQLFVDSRNRVWVVPFRNSICYYLHGELHNQENDPILRQLSIGSEITSIKEDKSGNIIMTEAYAIHIISPRQVVKNITQMERDPVTIAIGGGLNRDSLFSFFMTRKKTDNRQYVIDKKGISFIGKRNFIGWSANTTLISPSLNIFQDKDSLYLEPLNRSRFQLPIPHKFSGLSKIDDSLFTMNTSDGAFMYNTRTGKQSAVFLKGQSVNTVIRDSEGSFWFMCAGGGVFRIGSLGFRNTIFGDNEHSSVTCIRNIDSILYIGTEGSCLWKADLCMKRISKQEISWRTKRLGRILSIVPVEKDKLLLGTDGGLIQLDHLNEDRLLEYFSVKSIQPQKGCFLIGTMEKVELRGCPDLRPMTILWMGRSTCAYQQDSLIYIGTINGLYSVVRGGKAISWGSSLPVLQSRIEAIAASSDGTLWAGTSGHGIVGIKGGEVVCQLTEKEGLTSNTCRTLFISGDDIWVGTDKGLNRIHRIGSHFQVTNFSRADGLSSDVVNVIYVNGGDVYVGSANGLTHFNTREAGRNSFCKLRITSIQAVHAMWNHDTSGLVLPHRESSIRVDFAGISYRSAGDIVYSYRLKGLNDAWQSTRESFLSYPTLPSGQYVLEIRATNKFGVQSDPVRISFKVDKLLWENLWFIVLAGAFLAGGIWWLVWLRIQGLYRKNAEKLSVNNRIAELEQMSLKAQMNPHFIFNSLNSIQKYVIEKDIRGANKFITDFSRLIRLTLEITSKSRISIEEEVGYISSYLELEMVRFGNTFKYDISIGSGIDRFTYYIPPMLLQPYVENSIRHGLRYREDDKGMVLLQFMENASHLIIIIEDNGVGRKLAGLYKSLSPIEYQSRGMNLTERRMEMMNQGRTASISIDVEDMETNEQGPVGTRVILRFPIQYVKN